VTRVAWLAVAPVKGLALSNREELLLERTGASENRRFYVVDETGRRFGLMRYGPLALVHADYDETDERLTLRFPDGETIDATVELGDAVATDFYGRPVAGHEVVGPWSDALSRYARRPLRLVRADRPGDGVDRGNHGSVSIVSQASLDELARRTNQAEVDARRFRMLIGVDGCAAHAEDDWIGGEVRIGDALLRIRDEVGRCAITTQNPDTGKPDLDTLRTIIGYRPRRDPKQIPFGVYGDVVEAGRVRVGDAVEAVQPRLFAAQ
jgi:MOSC domain-containing protein